MPKRTARSTVPRLDLRPVARASARRRDVFGLTPVACAAASLLLLAVVILIQPAREGGFGEARGRRLVGSGESSDLPITARGVLAREAEAKAVGGAWGGRSATEGREFGRSNAAKGEGVRKSAGVAGGVVVRGDSDGSETAGVGTGDGGPRAGDGDGSGRGRGGGRDDADVEGPGSPPPASPQPPPPPSPSPPPPPPPDHDPPRLAALQERASALVREAKAEAKAQGIQTEVDVAAAQLAAAELASRLPRADEPEDDREWEGWQETGGSGGAESGKGGESSGAGAAAAAEGASGVPPTCESDAVCQPHGICEDGWCQCTALYHGVACGHALALSEPLVPRSSLALSAGFEGELVMTSSMPGGDMRVWLPGRRLEPAGDVGDRERRPAGRDTGDAPGGRSRAPLDGVYGRLHTLVDASVVEQLRLFLPASDPAFKSKVYRSCSVVGTSGSLLRGSHGAEIDASSLVLRVDAAPASSPAASAVGARTSARVTGLGTWGWHEGGGEVVVVETRSSRVVRGLAHNAQLEEPLNLLALSAPFQSWVSGTFGEATDSATAALGLALHVCRHVKVYGFLPGSLLHAPPSYYDGCATSDDAAAAGSAANVSAHASDGAGSSADARDPPPALSVPMASRLRILSAFRGVGALSLPEACAPECAGLALDAGRACARCVADLPDAGRPPVCDPGRPKSRPAWRDEDDLDDDDEGIDDV